MAASPNNSDDDLATLLQTKEQDLITLQTNFDEYIASSRELEEELDAEITALHEKIHESSAANQSLIAQLKSVTPQIESLESSVDALSTQLQNCRTAKLKAEQSSDELSSKIREMEVTLEQLRASEEQATEELALQMGELEEAREEYSAEINRLRNELTEVMHKLESREEELSNNNALPNSSASENIVDVADTNGGGGDPEYIKSLEDELELVSEQLIDAQNQLSEVAAQLDSALTDREESERLIVELSEKADQLEQKLNKQDLGDEEKINLTRQIANLVEDAGVMNEELELAQEESTALHLQLQSLEEECKALKAQNSDKETKIHKLNSQLASVKSGSGVLESGHSGLSGSDSSNDFANVQAVIDTSDVSIVSKALQYYADKAVAQQKYNALLLNKILKLQGNIQVCCRIRPLSAEEKEEGNEYMVEALSETELGCYDSRSRSWKSFAFDRVWGIDFGQAGIFQDVEPLALSVVDGYNACIFAYGQTGSGKTYTMEGIPTDPGISHRTILKTFALLSQKKSTTPEFHFHVTVGMLEVYNDEIYDLLSNNDTIDGNKTLDVRRSNAGYMEVPGLTRESVTSPSDVVAVLNRGNSQRATSSTNMNEHSSRSHMVLHAMVHTKINQQDQPVGNLYLVDLAGSERVRKSGVEGSEMKEAQHINKSLSALGDVMAALDEKKSHIPFRNSKLTYLLQDSLGGNSRTMMVVTVCPGTASVDESICTLGFATRVRRINLGSAQRNVSNKNLEENLKNAKREMKKTEEQLLALRLDHQRIAEHLQASQEMRKQNKDESRTISALRKSNEDLSKRLQKENELRQEKTSSLDASQKEIRRLEKELQNATREKDNMSKRVLDYERDVKELKRDLREAKDKEAAANIRVRKSNIMNGSNRNGSINRVAAKRPPSRLAPSKQTTAKITPSPRKSKDMNQATDKRNDNEMSVEKIRDEIKALLEKHDPSKVSKLEDLMERFVGKEARLLAKMKVRYNNNNSPTSVSTSVKKRTELAMERHAERMRKIRESNSPSTR